MNASSLRRFVLTLLTGYLAIFGVRQLPYEFDNEWLVLIPVLLLVYVITTWLDSKLFGENSSSSDQVKRQAVSKAVKEKKGFG
ncbi:MAG: hypothetical protein CMN91_02540 [Synechococcus sp. ARS1019]|nr:hypothetical protein [Synechococcus sp. ARS1019]|tara:strand:+ start:1258 stop:1506 length:249 start_codon:yes stop_codon:yes gene_type:complete